MKNLLLLLTLLTSQMCLAQTFTITGEVTDTLKNPLAIATVMLLEQDSTLVDFAQTDLSGNYQFKKVEKGDYLIKATYLGYIPMTLSVQYQEGKIKMEPMRLTEIAAELMEVVIKAARAPMKMRGDTIEYDASTFRVPEGSTVEDLLRRLPGMEVDRDGSLKSDGKDITRVTVEGKDFFGGDPTTVTKNLPAEGVSKVQVFDKKSETEKLTGIKQSSEEKEMNITLKEEFKKGGFGKVIVGAGDIKRGEIKGNYNKFDEKQQFSIVGVRNNTGRNGLNWDDYQDFMGSGAFNFGGGLDYGFGGGGGMRFFSFGGNGGNDLESKISSAFFGGNEGGFPENGNIGLNYNYDHKKTKVGSTYFYNLSGTESETISKSTNYFSNFNTNSDRTSDNTTGFNGHRGEVKFEQELDTFHTLVINADLANVISKRDGNAFTQILRNEDDLTSRSDISNDFRLGGTLINTSALLRKSFEKKGRFLGVNLSYLDTHVDEARNLDSKIDFFSTGEVIDSSQVIKQNNNSIADKSAFKANAMFSEPLSKTWFVSVFTNYSTKTQEGDVDVKDQTELGFVTNDLLTRQYETQIDYYRSGSTITYSNDGLNISVGGGYQRYDLAATYSAANNSPFNGTVDNPYDGWLPYVDISYSMGRNGRLSTSYSKSIDEPQIEDLLPIVDNSNPLFIKEGNPNLLPESTHNIRFNINKSFPLSGIRIYFNGGGTFYDNQVIQEETVDENLITRSKPINYDGGNRLNSYVGFSFPIIKNKIKSSINMNATVSKSFAFVNTILNETNTSNLRPRMSIDITPTPNIGLYINGSIGVTNTEYSISNSQNQRIQNSEIGVQFNTKIYKGLFIATSYDHTFYKNDRFGENTDIPIINASIYQQVLKGKRGEIRLSIYDALNKSVRFSQFAGSNRVSQTSTNSLARYVLATFTYNLRGVKDGVQRDNWW